MYNNPYLQPYSPQATRERIDTQIAQLQQMKEQIKNQQAVPTNLTQNFQITPTNKDVIKYADSMEEVQKESVITDTPYFSKNMSVMWIKNVRGEIKTYELTEIIPKDEKDIKIELLQAQIEELKKGMKDNARTSYANVDEPIEDEEPSNVSNGRTSTKKQKQSYRNV